MYDKISLVRVSMTDHETLPIRHVGFIRISGMRPHDNSPSGMPAAIDDTVSVFGGIDNSLISQEVAVDGQKIFVQIVPFAMAFPVRISGFAHSMPNPGQVLGFLRVRISKQDRIGKGIEIINLAAVSQTRDNPPPFKPWVGWS